MMGFFSWESSDKQDESPLSPASTIESPSSRQEASRRTAVGEDVQKDETADLAKEKGVGNGEKKDIDEENSSMLEEGKKLDLDAAELRKRPEGFSTLSKAAGISLLEQKIVQYGHCEQDTIVTEDQKYKHPDVLVFHRHFSILPEAVSSIIVDGLTEVFPSTHHFEKILPEDKVFLEKFKNLRTLKLEYNYLQSLENFPFFEYLQFLSLKGNKITSLRGLPHGRHLKILSLWGNKIETLKHMPYDAQLEELDLSNNSLRKLGKLAERCPNLRRLYLGYNNILDLEEISSLTSLKHLEEIEVYKNPCSELLEFLIKDITQAVERENSEKMKADPRGRRCPRPVVRDIEQSPSDKIRTRIENIKKNYDVEIYQQIKIMVQRRIKIQCAERGLACQSLKPQTHVANITHYIVRNTTEIQSLNQRYEKKKALENHDNVVIHSEKEAKKLETILKHNSKVSFDLSSNASTSQGSMSLGSQEWNIPLNS